MGRIRKPATSEPEESPVIEESPAADIPVFDVNALQRELWADEVLLQRILGLLYLAKKHNTITAALSVLDIERALGLPRETGTFVFSYMKTKNFLVADDKSKFSITTTGVDYLRTTFKVEHGNPQTTGAGTDV